MVYKLLLSINLIFGAFTVTAQTAEDYFHRGAQYYIWNDKQKATNEIFSGLRLFPTDPQLNGLAALIKKEEEQQKQQQPNQQTEQAKQDQKNQPEQQQQQAQQKGQQNQSQQQNPDQQKQQQQQDQQQQPAAQKQQEQQKQPAGSSPEQPKNQSGDTNQEEYAAGQMTPDQARQLLDAQKGDEKMLPVKPEGERRKRLRDW